MVAGWDGETLTVHASTQSPSIFRAAVASSLGLATARVRVVVPDVGGGFGLKMQVFPEEVAVAAAARLLGRDRQVGGGAAREPARRIPGAGERHRGRAGRGRRGTLARGARSRALGRGRLSRVPDDPGPRAAGHGHDPSRPLPLAAYQWEAIAVRTHKPPLGAYRGVGMTMGAFVMERMLDLLADRLGLDPAEVRRRNLIPRAAYPYTSASGQAYDSGDLPAALERLLTDAGYEDLRRGQARARAQGRWVGIGLACYTEYTGMGSGVFRRRGMVDVPGPEAGRVTVEPDGTVRCAVSFPSQGQGHATVVAQLVADRLGVTPDRVRLLPVDTAAGPAGSGTFASRGAVAMGGSVVAAAQALRERIVRLAAHLLEAGAEDIVLADGRVSVRGASGSGLALAEIARRAYAPPAGGWPGVPEPGLEATVHFDPPGPTFSGAAHLAVVEVDPDTGRVRIVKYALVEDCGPLINPLIVDGQIHGAVAQGIGEALFEELAHDESGQLLSATLMDYALPKASDLPSFEVGHVQTPSPLTPGGFKGMGEGGTIGAPAAVANAVADAVRAAGVSIVALPIRAEPLTRRSG